MLSFQVKLSRYLKCVVHNNVLMFYVGIKKWLHVNLILNFKNAILQFPIFSKYNVDIHFEQNSI